MAQFQPGNPGRPKGARNKSNRKADEAFDLAFDALQTDDTTSLTGWAKANATEFYKLFAKRLTQTAENTNLNTNETVSEAQARAEAEAFIESQRLAAQRLEPEQPGSLRAADEAGLPAGEPSLPDR